MIKRYKCTLQQWETLKGSSCLLCKEGKLVLVNKHRLQCTLCKGILLGVLVKEHRYKKIDPKEDKTPRAYVRKVRPHVEITPRVRKNVLILLD